MDRLSPEVRSAVMSRIRGRDTNPELVVRRLASGMGYRYRLCVGSLPGSPDLVFTRLRKVVFVHGCFWHRHTCRRGTMPSTRKTFWRTKLEGNRTRDRRNVKRLRKLGWSVLVIWECQIGNPERLAKRIARFLSA